MSMRMCESRHIKADVCGLTRAEIALLAAIDSEPTIKSAAVRLRINHQTALTRGRIIRDKLHVDTMQEAVTAWKEMRHD